MTTIDILKKTRAARGELAVLDEAGKNALLLSMADSLLSHEGAILTENAADMADARGHISDVMLDRLRLDHDRLAGMADGVGHCRPAGPHRPCAVRGTPPQRSGHPEGTGPSWGWCPLSGESRPNVTSDAAALALKSGNVCVLRSGREAYRTARAIVQALKAGIAAEGGDPDILNIVDDTTHQSAADIMTAKGLVDLLIPRGGAGLDPGLRSRRHRALH